MRNQINLNTVLLGISGFLSSLFYYRIDTAITKVYDLETRVSVLESEQKRSVQNLLFLDTADIPKNKFLTQK